MKIILTILMLLSIFVFSISLRDYSKYLKIYFLINNLLKSDLFDQACNYISENDKKTVENIKSKGKYYAIAVVMGILVYTFSISLMIILIIGLYS